MRIIIAGGRDYLLNDTHFKWIDSLDLDITEVVSGTAPGADAGGEAYARANGITITRFKPDWHKHGRAAGPIRNRQMAEYADGLVLFPGGRGTNSMRNIARELKIIVHEFQEHGGVS